MGGNLSNDEEKILIARSLRKEDPKFFDYRTISTLIGKSVSYTHKLMNEGTENG